MLSPVTMHKNLSGELIVQNRFFTSAEYADLATSEDIFGFAESIGNLDLYIRNNSRTKVVERHSADILDGHFRLSFILYSTYRNLSESYENHPHETESKTTVTFSDGERISETHFRKGTNSTVEYLGYVDATSVFSTARIPDGTYTVMLNNDTYQGRNHQPLGFSFSDVDNPFPVVRLNLPEDLRGGLDASSVHIYFNKSPNFRFFIPLHGEEGWIVSLPNSILDDNGWVEEDHPLPEYW